ncbi:Protein mlo2 [Smittium culicis]|uniref:Protein mlo2 n=1 Tax=Smittium culicis TaxID=133412 RepID=A0A1R1XX35_9FUNG|nr:Protein mlo2 [Smittium culicis]
MIGKEHVETAPKQESIKPQISPGNKDPAIVISTDNLKDDKKNCVETRETLEIDNSKVNQVNFKCSKSHSHESENSENIINNECENSDNGKKQDSITSADLLTASEYLELQDKLEKEAANAFPGKFDFCTWEKGYINQPVYACLTCSRYKNNPNEHSKTLSVEESIINAKVLLSEKLNGKEKNTHNSCTETVNSSLSEVLWDPRVSHNAFKPNNDHTPPDNFNLSGICYGCSISCHSSHDVIELFSKRDFCCDCGTNRLKNTGVSGCTLKKNVFNISSITNNKNKYTHNFWGYYCRCDTFYNPEVEKREMIQCYTCNDWFHDSCIGMIPSDDDYDEYICRDYNESSRVTTIQDHNRLNIEEIDCESIEKEITPNAPPILALETKQYEITKDSKKVDLFIKDGFFNDLCKCESCKSEMQINGLDFLYHEYSVFEPELDDSRTDSLYEAGIKELEKIDRTQAVEGSIAYRGFYDEIKKFLSPFAESKRPVSQSDIMDFFNEIKIKKQREL